MLKWNFLYFGLRPLPLLLLLGMTEKSLSLPTLLFLPKLKGG